MSAPFVLRFALALLCVLPATSGLAQSLPAIPPSIDPDFWGRAHAPYRLKLTVTTTKVTGKEPPQTHVGVMNVYRDSNGRVCDQVFYDNGRPMGVGIRDPGKNTFTDMRVFDKSFYVFPTPRPAIPPPGKGWTVERLPARVIAGFPAEGFRFIRTIPASDDGKRAADRVIDEEWISSTLYLVLEQKTESLITGTTTRTVSQFEQVEPDATLFTIPSDYSAQQSGPSAKPPY